MRLHAHELDDMMTLELESAELPDHEGLLLSVRKIDQVGLQSRYRRQGRQYDDGSSVRSRSRK